MVWIFNFDLQKFSDSDHLSFHLHAHHLYPHMFPIPYYLQEIMHLLHLLQNLSKQHPTPTNLILLQQASGNTLDLQAVFPSLTTINPMKTKMRRTITITISMMKPFAGPSRPSHTQLLWLVLLLYFTKLW